MTRKKIKKEPNHKRFKNSLKKIERIRAQHILSPRQSLEMTFLKKEELKEYNVKYLVPSR